MSEATWMRLSKYIRIRNNILQGPDSLQILQELVRYYSGCGYKQGQASLPGFFRWIWNAGAKTPLFAPPLVFLVDAGAKTAIFAPRHFELTNLLLKFKHF